MVDESPQEAALATDNPIDAGGHVWGPSLEVDVSFIGLRGGSFESVCMSEFEATFVWVWS